MIKIRRRTPSKGVNMMQVTSHDTNKQLVQFYHEDKKPEGRYVLALREQFIRIRSRRSTDFQRR